MSKQFIEISGSPFGSLFIEKSRITQVSKYQNPISRLHWFVLKITEEGYGWFTGRSKTYNRTYLCSSINPVEIDALYQQVVSALQN